MLRALLAVSLVSWLVVTPTFAADPVDPLEFLPSQANLVLKVEKPRGLVEGILKLEAYDSLKQFPQVRELLDSSQARRFFQVVAYFERELGAPWPELIDKIAGGGIALGVATGVDPAPSLLVIQGTDARAVESVYAQALAFLEEQSRRDSGVSIVQTSMMGDVPVVQLSKDSFLARVGTTIFVANKEASLRTGLQLASGKKGDSVAKRATLMEARKLAGKTAAAWGWLDLAQVKSSKQARDFFDSTRKDIFQTLVAGSTIDAVRRSDFVSFAVDLSSRDYSFSVRLPAKRKDLDDVMRLHVPAGDRPGSLPVLQPEGVIYSQSFYLDLAHLWKNRKTIINEQNLKDIEKGISDLNRVIPSTTFGELLEQSGPYHRFIVAHTGEKLYDTRPAQPIPSSALVLTMRDSSFGQSMNGLLRAGALIAGFQTGWVMSEESHDGTTIVSYRFPETGSPKFADPEKLRFNFVPSFAIVDRYLVLGATPGIIKRLIPLLKAESKDQGHSAVWQTRVFASGVADLLAAYPEQTITTAVLSQGIGLKEAEKQVQAFVNWLRELGSVEARFDHRPEMFEFQLKWQLRP